MSKENATNYLVHLLVLGQIGVLAQCLVEEETRPEPEHVCLQLRMISFSIESKSYIVMGNHFKVK